MKTVYKAADITEAHIIRGLLEVNDIDSYIGGFYLQGGVGDLSPMDFARVHVHESDEERAMQIISEYEGQKLEVVQTPYVGASTLFYRLGLVVLFTLMLFLVGMLVNRI